MVIIYLCDSNDLVLHCVTLICTHRLNTKSIKG